MADKMYAWSTFHEERNEYGQPTKTISPGDTVTQDQLGVSDEEWEYLIETGVVRTEEYPEDIPEDMAPAEYEKQKMAEFAAGTLPEDEMEEIQEKLDEEAEPPDPEEWEKEQAEEGSKASPEQTPLKAAAKVENKT